MGMSPVFLASLSNCAQTALSLQRHSMTSMLDIVSVRVVVLSDGPVKGG